MGLIRLLFRWLICSFPDDANQEEDNMEHRCIIGVIASPEGLMIGYAGDERLMREYGGMEFPYCPMCTQPNGAISMPDMVRRLVAEYGAEAVLAAAGRI